MIHQRRVGFCIIESNRIGDVSNNSLEVSIAMKIINLHQESESVTFYID